MGKIYNDEYSKSDLPTWKKYELRHPGKNNERRRTARKIESKDSQRAKQLKWRFSLPYEEYNQKLLNQNYKCAICFKKLLPHGTRSEGFFLACVDHNHITGQIRDLLCRSCNTVLGHVKEQKEILQNMISYIDKWSHIDE